jgi:hypothetical protein
MLLRNVFDSSRAVFQDVHVFCKTIFLNVPGLVFDRVYSRNLLGLLLDRLRRSQQI